MPGLKNSMRTFFFHAGFALTLLLIPQVVHAERCSSVFERSGLPYSAYATGSGTSSRSYRRYLSWNGGEPIECNKLGSESYNCAGRIFKDELRTIIDKTGTGYHVSWQMAKSSSFKCFKTEDGLYTEVITSYYNGSLDSSGVGPRLFQVAETYTRLRAWRPQF
jgi:hypothetical protein